MAIKVALNHWMHYRYDSPIELGPHIVRLKPAPHCRTTILSYAMRITPATHFINWQQDPFGNYLARLVFPERTRELRVEVDLLAEMTVVNPFDFFVEPHAADFPFKYSDASAKELQPYLAPTEDDPVLRGWLAANTPAAGPIIDWLVAINQAVQRDVKYRVRMEPGVQTTCETLTLASGSCRDSGWLLVEILRHCGLAARFVSGYLVQLTSDEKPLEGPAGPTQDFTDLHAWAEVFLPGAGWVGLDPTSGLFAGEGHIPLACTPMPASAAPVTGDAEVAKTEFTFSNSITRIDEQTRVTKPLSDRDWKRVLALGAKVDQRLARQDVRLTMGGEPTFVSLDHMDGAEWKFAALGEEKLALSSALMGRMRNAFGKGGVTQFAQGKWYPGEVTPRWAMSCYWRTDGKPLWTEPDRLLLPQPGKTKPQSQDAAAGQAKELLSALVEELGIASDYVRPLHEDPLHNLQLESLLPDDQTLDTLKLSDSQSRRALARRLSHGLDQPVAWVLPLRHTDENWISCHWPSRRNELFLVPGDSPAGLRLPLGSLPTPDDIHDEAILAMPEDAFSPDAALPDPAAASPPASGSEARQSQDRDKIVFPTALCVESRDDNLYVFLPPLTNAVSYVLLLQALERATVRANVNIVLEGYEPPSDPRLQNFRITPDPGVIEVNIHPSRTFDELVERTETLYALARETRLSAEKFMVDGRHTGTGGGNHVTFGGPTPADSPFLRRPHLLGSLITYWQHHPCLSYLFSGMFVGPTSQAPRVDEARVETLYELELALSRLPAGDVQQPWLVDRLLRHLLIDVTGNTHRAEICIDKLYSPDGPAGRLGLVELRAFEMPPHARMSIVQALLLRSLISRFWDAPYKGKLIRWGTELHDRFMLPHYLWRDLLDVIDDLQNSGLDFDPQWLKSFFEFRFPLYGERQVDDITLELRAAIEPWHVLGEEGTGSGMARYVDSSMERLQLRVTGLTDERYRITCNGNALTMRKSGTHGEYIVGVRYRAWQPPSCLHPDLPVNVPLVFDVVDTWKARSLGGCAYHVAHPGGRSHEDLPVNANVAEARRLARFETDFHTPDSAASIVLPDNSSGFFCQTDPADKLLPYTDLPSHPEYPHTADLRRTDHRPRTPSIK